MERSGAALERSNATLERSNAALERSDAALDRYDAVLEHLDAALERLDATLEQSDAVLNRYDAALDRYDAALEASRRRLRLRQLSSPAGGPLVPACYDRNAMGVIHIDLPDSVLLTTGQSQEELVREAKFLLALKLFELGRMSSGVAAEVSGIPRVDFLLRASQAAVPVADLDEEELDRELRDG